jgi:hypothetical protein
MRAFARVFPIGRPRLLLLEGLAAWITGSRGKAQSAWAESLEQGQALGMQYEVGRTHLEIGRRLDPADPARQEHLEKAAGVFMETGAELERSQARTLLGGGGAGGN